MNVVVGSAHRNSARRATGYMEQIARLKAALHGLANFRVVAVEGDSTDDTREALKQAAAVRKLDLELVTCNHGGPEFGSVESVDRFRALSKVGNAIFDSVRGKDDVLLYVESDLTWRASTMVCLAQYVVTRASGFDVFAPLVMAGELFYDIWGFRGLDGRRFSPFKPHYPGLNGQPFFEVGSAGSCLAIPGAAARSCRIIDDECLVGWCRDARSQGYKIAVAPLHHVRQA